MVGTVHPMQLDQPPPDLAIPEPSPFDHLRPSLWEDSKVAHITLVSLGGLMLLPAALVMFVFVQAFLVFGRGGMGGMGGIPDEAMLALITAVGSTCVGVIAWTALCLLLFKRTDARWQRICWGFCAVFGIVASPCIAGWMIWIAGEGVPNDDGWIYLIFLLMLGIAIASLVFGVRFSRAAAKALRHPPTAEDQIFRG